MAGNKTTETTGSVDRFIRGVADQARRTDAVALRDLMTRVTGTDAKMWGSSIIGFGSYHYRYESGREGDSARVGFSPRKASLVLYLNAKGEHCEELRSRLGKHRTGVSCLYINRLGDVDLEVLEQLIASSWALSQQRHGDSVPGNNG